MRYLLAIVFGLFTFTAHAYVEDCGENTALLNHCGPGKHVRYDFCYTPTGTLVYAIHGWNNPNGGYPWLALIFPPNRDKQFNDLWARAQWCVR